MYFFSISKTVYFTAKMMPSVKYSLTWWYLLLMCKKVITQDPVAILPQGRIVGVKVYSEGSLNPVEIFFGVPYATPPIGRYRLSAPERHTGWRRTFFAHRMPPHCPRAGDSASDSYSEDCLFLNIWTTRRADGKSLPVVVIFYSESWTGGGISLPCQELAVDGVVVVTVAYRQHLLAFFTLKTISARGNLAILDQYLALLWVRDNIAAFGGDPTTITIAGHSAGADSVLYHISSPRSIGTGKLAKPAFYSLSLQGTTKWTTEKSRNLYIPTEQIIKIIKCHTGLFQRAIIMSPQNPWKLIDESYKINVSVSERISREAAYALGCVSNSDQEILKCMRSRPLSDILALYSNANWSKYLQPVPDDFLPESEQYLPTPLPVALSASQQPMQLDLILGATDLEAINYNDENYVALIKQDESHNILEFAENKAIPKLLRMFSLHQSEAIATLSQAIRWEYWGAMTKKDIEKRSFDAVESLARMESSAIWGAGNALLAAKLARRVSRLFAYRYLEPANIDLKGRQMNFTGAIHGSDLMALFGDPLILQVARRPSTTEEKRISTIFRRYITNFIKYGSPGTEEEWRRYKVGDAQIHDIHMNSKININKYSANKDISFWLQYLPKLSNIHSTIEHSEQYISEKDEGRLRGGVYAMCGVTGALLILLCACLILLRRERAFRAYNTEEMHN